MKLHHTLLLAGIITTPFIASALVLPSVMLTNLTLQGTTFNAGDAITGSFAIANNDSHAQYDLGYEVQIMQADSASPVFSQTYPLHLSLQPHTSAKESLSVTIPPAVPSGTYRMMVRVVTQQGIQLGWQNKDIAIAGSSGAFVSITDASILDVFKKTVAPDSGPTLMPNVAPTVQFTAHNTGANPLKVRPQIHVYMRSEQGTEIIATTSAEIVIPADGSKKITLNLPAQSKPESYLSKVMLVDAQDKPVSPYVYFRWVVAGISGKIQSVDAQEQANNCNTLPVHVLYTGPADGTNLQGLRLSIVAKDADGQVLGSKDQSLTESSGVANASVPLTKCPKAVALIASLMAGDEMLDSQTIAIQSPAQQGKNNALFAPSIVLILLLAACLAYVLLLKRREAVPQITA